MLSKVVASLAWGLVGVSLYTVFALSDISSGSLEAEIDNLMNVKEVKVVGQDNQLEVAVEFVQYRIIPTVTTASNSSATFEDAHRNGSYSRGYSRLPSSLDDLPLEVENSYLSLSDKKMRDFEKRLKNTKRYDNYIRNAANETGLPFSLIKAMVARESNGKDNAISRKGARGPMQLMRGTAKFLSEMTGLECYENIDDPKTNIMCGAKYVEWLEKKFGDRTLALAAYNWGPGNVKKFVAKGHGFDQLFGGTKQYVTDVLVMQCLYEKR